ncbi:MAG: transglycosylase SLT domain-containing protein [Thiothrix sp.]|nr:transglycosylase SLT domain-containing protein [Thiothrix sp.]HPQ94934.1 transglycosylase SLT domain-containing protein [Thiolinea sp.]
MNNHKAAFAGMAVAIAVLSTGPASANPPEALPLNYLGGGQNIPEALPLPGQMPAWQQQQQQRQQQVRQQQAIQHQIEWQRRQAMARSRASQQIPHYNSPPQFLHTPRQEPAYQQAPQLQLATFARPQPQAPAWRNDDGIVYQQDDASAWDRVFATFRLPDYSGHPRVRTFIQRYARNPGQMSILSARADTFLHMIIEEVNRRGIPSEIALLPFVESGFNPDVFSHAGAAGLWQFIPSTGKTYGLNRAKGQYDARMDPFAATGAALNYLQKLNREFNGDWLLALAAYNCGENRVHRAVRQARARGLNPTFWNLSLPQETMNYVPKLLAFRELIGNAARYGIRLPETPNAAKLTQVRVNRALDLRAVATYAGLPANTLTELNPCFRTGITTPQHSNRIILPLEYAPRLIEVMRAMVTGRNLALDMNSAGSFKS